MKLEIFAICDAAADYRGKTCIMGTFDTVMAKDAPVAHRHLTIIAKLRFQPSDESIHKAAISFIDADGKPVMPPVVQDFPVHFGETQRSKVGNLILNINNLKLPRFGEYRVDLAVDGKPLGELPLYFVQIAERPK